MSTTPAEIKAKFKVYMDEMSFNLKNSELNRLFERAQDAYWNSLANKWGTSLENSVDIAPIVKLVNTLAPASNTILYSDLPNYERIGFVKPTYVVNGATYSFPAKILTENQKYSPLNQGTLSYPRYYETDTGIVLQPSDTPTNVMCTYLREPYPIDFDSPSDVIPYTEANVQGIITIALQNSAVSQREGDQAGLTIQEAQFNNQ
jgi:hypothetical protein